MSEISTQDQSTNQAPPPLPGQPPSKDVAKAAMMAAYSEKFVRIQVGKDAVASLEADASKYAEGILKDHGMGPHKMKVGEKTLIVTFQRVNKTVRAHTVDLADVT